jgi:ankyrin repeat protein
LLAAGASINARNKYFDLLSFYRISTRLHFSFSFSSRSFARVGQTALHKAAYMGHSGNVRQLLAASADKNARTK